MAYVAVDQMWTKRRKVSSGVQVASLQSYTLRNREFRGPGDGEGQTQ